MGSRAGEALRGYEMHLGVTTGPATARPMLLLGDRPEGAVGSDGRIQGCYLHGLFAADGFRRAWLGRLRAARGLGAAAVSVAYEDEIERTLDALADHLAAALDLDRILEIAHAR